MDSSIKKGFINNIKKIVKHGSYFPFMYAFLGLLCVLLIACYDLIAVYGSWWLYIIVLLGFICVWFVAFPFLYGVSLSIANSSRFKENENLGIKDVFRQYYRGNSNVFNVFSVFIRVFGTMFLSTIALMMIEMLIMRYTTPDLINELYNYFMDTSFKGSIYEYVSEEYVNIVHYYLLSLNSISLLPVFYVASSEMRKNESVFYCVNSLITDNKINVSTTMLTPVFRKQVLPTVKKEYLKLDLSINWIGYACFYGMYAVGIVLGFLNILPSGFEVIIALAMGLLIYCPFYYFERVFDNLFYIAYQDKIMSRVDEKIKGLILDGRKQLNPVFKSEQDNVVDEEVVDDTTVESKKGDVYENNVIDYTKKDDNSKDDDEEKK